jgi:hypothetical protein
MEEELYLSTGEKLTRADWWARRWGIVADAALGLRAVPYAELRQHSGNPMLFVVTFANEDDAQRMITAILGYHELATERKQAP